jgi:hypothetical protein
MVDLLQDPHYQRLMDPAKDSIATLKDSTIVNNKLIELDDDYLTP